jgi:molybdopterin-guanine dinucleotide biosynthesis protein A
LARVIDRMRPQVSQVALSANGDLARFSEFELPIIEDTVGGFIGPLAGLLAGLQWAQQTTTSDWIATMPSDTPFLPGDLVMRLMEGLGPDNEIAVARCRNRRHPTVALWAVALAGRLADWLADPTHRAIHDWLDSRTCSYVDFDDAAEFDPFFNVNTPDDLALARRHVTERA